MTKRVIRLAVNQACMSDMQARVGAVLVKRDSVIGVGYNRPNHPSVVWDKKFTHSKYSLHAERAALLGLRPYDVAGATMYVLRVRRDGSFGMAKPCNRCANMLKNYDIKVFYTTDKGEWRKW